MYDASTGQLLTNVSSESAEFVVSGVSASGALTVAVRAINKKGASNPFTMSSSLLKYPERHTGTHLTSTFGLTLAMRVVNKKGASNPFTLSNSLLNYPERKTGTELTNNSSGTRDQQEGSYSIFKQQNKYQLEHSKQNY